MLFALRKSSSFDLGLLVLNVALKYPKEEIEPRMMAWCDRQDRCTVDALQKMASWGVNRADAQNIMAELVANGFINNGRYAVSFSSGHFRIKNWGKVKIKAYLLAKKISEQHIEAALNAIDQEEYHAVVHKIIGRKFEQWSKLKTFDRNGKVSQFLMNRGFEPPLVWDCIREKTASEEG
jgi:regulatory protein